jgi:exodeoxyribonuclease VII small subunit
MAAKKFNFETAFKRLEEITKKLEENDIDLDTSVELYKEGMSLLKQCTEKLAEAEKTIYQLTKNADGTFSEIPFDSEDA